MRVSRLALCLTVAIVTVLLVAPAAAVAANAFGKTYAGQAKCLSCHGAKTGRWQVGTYPTTAHGLFITDAETAPAAIMPAASFWPSPAYGGGLTFALTDIKWMLGAPNMLKQYVTKFNNAGPGKTGTGMAFNAVAGPADDFLMAYGAEHSPELGIWEVATKVTVRTYFQGCGGCHHLGVTRPTDKEYTLGSGVQVSRNTPTTYAGAGIQCENCHGTGSTNADTRHWDTGVGVVRTKQVMKSAVCAQCHVNGYTKEKNWVGGTFSNPNGFTPDKKLSDYLVVRGSQYVRASLDATRSRIPTSDPQFYPNGANKAMNHGYYNEYMLSPHSRSLRWPDGSLWSKDAEDSCLRCHSGEGFLKSTDYATENLNDITLKPSTVQNDELNIECGVCHQIHSRTGEPLGLRMDKDALCKRCHTAEIPVGKTAVAGTEVLHSQTEMLEGRGLIGVAAAGTMHGKATCADCHMPITREPRISHRFRVMEPGQAEEWKVWEGGDSCTPCHSSSTRENLQESIDEWQTDVRAQTNVATATIAAASKRRAAKTSAGRALIAAAETNVSFVRSDGSRGVHNYEYATAGLAKAIVYAKGVGARFTSFGSTGYAGSGRTSLVFGTLLFGDGSGAKGETIAIEAAPAGTSKWKVIGSTTAGDGGSFAYAVRPVRSTSYRARWAPRPLAIVRSNTTTVRR